MAIATINPATGETLREFEALDEPEVEAALKRAVQVFDDYRHTAYADRARWLLRAAEILESEKAELGRLMTLEMGKPWRAAQDEAAKSAMACRYYAEYGEKLLTDDVVETKATRSFTRCQPLGAILAIMPWNFPFWQVFRFAAPALMAGNVGLLKHASNVPQCALKIEEILRRAGFPEGVFQTLLIETDATEKVVADARIKGVSLTGSEAAGSRVAAIAGENLKRTVLELGGSDPFIVLPSADLDAAVKTAVTARTINNGQSCIAAKRFIVAAEIYDEFEARFVEAMETLKVGDPLEDDTDIGPLATPRILESLHEQVQKSVAAGAKLLMGGHRVGEKGNFYAPTVLTSIPEAAPAFHEELFGPVASLFRVRDIDEAIELANATSFGLGSSAWTNDPAEQERLINEIEAGMVFINAMVASDAHLPFGGIKRSGYGRELGTLGIREFINEKAVWVA